MNDQRTLRTSPVKLPQHTSVRSNLVRQLNLGMRNACRKLVVYPIVKMHYFVAEKKATARESRAISIVKIRLQKIKMNFYEDDENGVDYQDDGVEEDGASANPGTWEDIARRFGRPPLSPYFWAPAESHGLFRAAETYEYGSLETIRRETTEAMLSGLHGNLFDHGYGVSSIVVPGSDHHARKFLPELFEVSRKVLKKQLLQKGLLDERRGHGEWPPQTYSPIDPGKGTARSSTR